MTPSRRGSRWGARFAALAALAVATIVAAGCAATVTPTPEAVPTATATSPQAPTGPTKNPVALPQSDTPWGRIWDAVPPDFPLPAGARPTQTGDGPASAVLDVPGDAIATMEFLQSALELAGFPTESLSGPLEDGSRVLESSGEGACRVRVLVAPLGGTTIMTVLYGAACPFP